MEGLEREILIAVELIIVNDFALEFSFIESEDVNSVEFRKIRFS